MSVSRAMRMAVMVSKRVGMAVVVVRMARASQQPQNLPVSLGRSLGPRLSSSGWKSCAGAWTNIFSTSELTGCLSGLDVQHLTRCLWLSVTVSISECLWFPTPCLAGEGKVQKRSKPKCDENQGKEMDAGAGARWLGGRGGLLGTHEAASRDLNEFFPVTHVLTFF